MKKRTLLFTLYLKPSITKLHILSRFFLQAFQKQRIMRIFHLNHFLLSLRLSRVDSITDTLRAPKKRNIAFWNAMERNNIV